MHAYININWEKGHAITFNLEETTFEVSVPGTNDPIRDLETRLNEVFQEPVPEHTCFKEVLVNDHPAGCYLLPALRQVEYPNKADLAAHLQETRKKVEDLNRTIRFPNTSKQVREELICRRDSIIYSAESKTEFLRKNTMSEEDSRLVRAYYEMCRSKYGIVCTIGRTIPEFDHVLSSAHRFKLSTGTIVSEIGLGLAGMCSSPSYDF